MYHKKLHFDLTLVVQWVSKSQDFGYSLDLGLSRHCREDNRILETMIVATIVAIVATIKKIAKLLILKAKFKEINHII